ncbi:MAG: DUF6036 family nucleotidyltransferase [Eubacteriales bacterium]|nr:DUF6036 family nucleotidyltransferase [Eubacteriales bacterium]
MTRSEGKITRENAFDIIKKFATEYRKELGKIPGEIIIVGGGSIMLNYKFRDATQDFDVILKTVSGIEDVIRQFAEKNDLPIDWMNSDFLKTESYSSVLSEVSKHYYTLNNGTLEIRTVSGVYLIAMKLRARRDYRNDISDTIGILIEEYEDGNHITFEQIQKAYVKLYHIEIPEELQDKMKTLCSMTIDQLKDFYSQQNSIENELGGKIITYLENGANINTKNVDEVIAKIKEKMGK